MSLNTLEAEPGTPTPMAPPASASTTAPSTPAPRRRDASEPTVGDLVAEAKDGSQGARAALVARYRPGVVKLARRHGRRTGSLEDLVQEGNLGLLDAIRGFDPDRGVTFWTYAHYWVSYRIRQFVLANRRIVRMPRSRSARRMWGGIGRAERELTAELGMPPSRAQIAERLEVGEKELDDFKGFVSPSNDVELDGFRRAEVPAATASPEQLASEEQTRRRWKRSVAEAMRHLDDREQLIIERRFLAPETESYAALGRQFGISRERVRQLAERGLKKMRTRVEASLPAELGFAASA